MFESQLFWPHMKNTSYFFPSLGSLFMMPFLLEGKCIPSWLPAKEIHYV